MSIKRVLKKSFKESFNDLEEVVNAEFAGNSKKVLIIGICYKNS